MSRYAGDWSLSRRTVISFMSTVPLLGVGSCSQFCKMRRPEIQGEAPLELEPILRPPRIQKGDRVPALVIDVHAHFFNARDVPIRGYLAGPVAHSIGGPIGKLLRALAPIAEWLGSRAPRASEEFSELVALASGAAFSAMSQDERMHILNRRREKFFEDLSPRLYAQLKAVPEFVLLYNGLQSETRSRFRSKNVDAPSLSENSLFRVMQRDLQSKSSDVDVYGSDAPPPYADGVLAFVGYMLSYRWMNLLAYQRAYTTDDSAFGVNQVLGALVDFDNWLTPLPRTTHEDQIKLHQLLSQLSGGYMRPLVAYNPWSDAVDNGRTMARTLDALDQRGFVGVKIYPPNGFRPYGNSLTPAIPKTPGMPSASDLDRVLLRLWEECSRRNVPVMAHSGNSMGSDDAHSAAAGPAGWRALIAARGAANPIRANLGHFGGDSSLDNWNIELARLMVSPEGSALYADLGYWDELRCKGEGICSARQKLEKAFKEHPVVADRVMYGSDWLMLSQERSWDRYPFDILAALPLGLSDKGVFGQNALNCFPALKRFG